MQETIIERDASWFHRGVEKRKAEVDRLVRKRGQFFGFGASGKLEWARFKLDFKQEELDRFREQERPENKGTHRAGETTRQKMARMITENPVELEPHIRRAYQSLIDAGK